jgi:hypothetical protein
MRAFWNRRSKLSKTALIAGVVLVGLVALGALYPAEEDEAAQPVTPAVTEEVEDEEAEAAVVTGRVAGSFARDCVLCDRQLVRFIQTSDVWCGWQDGKVLVHVRMRNDSVEHITVNWHPAYIIARGGEHGAGLGAAQSDGFDAGETRSLTAEQEPEGVPIGSRIAKCKPSFSIIESG